MITEEAKKWIEAGKVFAIDKNANILCPMCSQAFLKTTDVFNEHNNQDFERVLFCPSCGARNYLKMKHKI